MPNSLMRDYYQSCLRNDETVLFSVQRALYRQGEYSLTIKGKVALVAANDPMLNLLIKDLLLDAGCTVCGSHLHYGEAIRAAETAEFDLGILNSTLQDGVKVYPVADRLELRGIPYVITAANPEIVRLERPGSLVVGKPFAPASFLEAVAAIIKPD